MELKKKTIIWEDNNEPPKDYIWAKKDGKFYEYSYATRGWVESKSISGGSGSGGGSMSMYDIWMKVFNGFKVVQNDGEFTLDIIPAIAVLNASFDVTSHYVDTPIPLSFVNSEFIESETDYYYTFNSDNIIVYNIKDVPDDIYDKGYMGYGAGVRFLYDLDELNEKAQNIEGAVDSIIIDQQGYDTNVVTLLRGRASYVPYSGVYKINDKYYVWFPNSMD